MAVNLLDLKAQNGALEAELNEAFLRVLRSGYFILGPEVARFEKMLAEFTGARVCARGQLGDRCDFARADGIGGSGRATRCCAQASRFFATAGCVSRVGATPVFVDSLADTFNLDVADAERRITPRTKAIIPVHLLGQSADMESVLALAHRHGLRVIEDAAQALGATHQGKQVGTLTGFGSLGGFGTISFFPSKNLGAFGDAGALLTNDELLFHGSRVLRTHGMDPKYYHAAIGGNFRIDALQAALLAVKLPHFATYTANRRRNAAIYTERLGGLPREKIMLPVTLPGYGHIWNQYTLRIPGEGRRDALRAHLTARGGIGSEIYYPVPLHEQECFAKLGYKPEDLPVAHRLTGEVLSLPVYPELQAEAVEEVCAGGGGGFWTVV